VPKLHLKRGPPDWTPFVGELGSGFVEKFVPNLCVVQSLQRPLKTKGVLPNKGVLLGASLGSEGPPGLGRVGPGEVLFTCRLD